MATAHMAKNINATAIRPRSNVSPISTPNLNAEGAYRLPYRALGKYIPKWIGNSLRLRRTVTVKDG